MNETSHIRPVSYILLALAILPYAVCCYTVVLCNIAKLLFHILFYIFVSYSIYEREPSVAGIPIILPHSRSNRRSLNIRRRPRMTLAGNGAA